MAKKTRHAHRDDNVVPDSWKEQEPAPLPSPQQQPDEGLASIIHHPLPPSAIAVAVVAIVGLLVSLLSTAAGPSPPPASAPAASSPLNPRSPAAQKVCTTLYILHLTSPTKPWLAPGPFEVLNLEPVYETFHPDAVVSLPAAERLFWPQRAADLVTQAWFDATLPYWQKKRGNSMFGISLATTDALGLSAEELQRNGLSVTQLARGMLESADSKDDADQKHPKPQDSRDHRQRPNKEAIEAVQLAGMTSAAAMLKDDEARALYMTEVLPRLAMPVSSLQWLRTVFGHQPKEPADKKRKQALKDRATVIQDMCSEMWTAFFSPQ